MRTIFIVFILLVSSASADFFSKEDADKYIAEMEYSDKYKLLNLCSWEADMAQSLQIGKQANPDLSKETHIAAIKETLRNEFSQEFIRKILGLFEIVWTIPEEKSSTEVFRIVYEDCRLLLASSHKDGFRFNIMDLEEEPFY